MSATPFQGSDYTIQDTYKNIDLTVYYKKVEVDSSTLYGSDYGGDYGNTTTMYEDDKHNKYTYNDIISLRKLRPEVIHGYEDEEGNILKQPETNDERDKLNKPFSSITIAMIVVAAILTVLGISFGIALICIKHKGKKVVTSQAK